MTAQMKEQATAPYAALLKGDQQALRCPVDSWRGQSERAPVEWFAEGGFFVITSHELVCEVMRDAENISALDAMGPAGAAAYDTMIRVASQGSSLPLDEDGARLARQVLLWADPPRHTAHRKMVTTVVKPARIREWVGPIRARADEIITPLVGAGEIDYRSQFALPYAMAVIMLLLGFPDEDIDDASRWSHDFVQIFGAADPEAAAEALAVTRAEFDAYLDGLLAERLESPRGDLMSDIAREYAEAGEEINAHELHTLIQVMFVGGNETAANTLVNAVLLLGQQPDLWERLSADHSLIPRFVEECLRTDAPAQGAFRQAKNDMVVGGVEIPAGSVIYAVFGAANFDPTLFSDPETFDLGRSNGKRHLAFGVGTHNCVGQNIAREELCLAIEALLDAAAGVRLCHEDEDVSDYLPSFVLRSPARLRVELLPRS